MIESIDKPALSALWPNKKEYECGFRSRANIEGSSKNLVDFSISAYHYINHYIQKKNKCSFIKY